MAQFTDYYRIVKPNTSRASYSSIDTQNSQNAGSTVFSNYSWYSDLMKGATTRYQRYINYDAMDQDPDVHRALDVISEDIAATDISTNLPFKIDYQNSDNEEVSESMVMTIKAALRYWIETQDLENRIFRTARFTIKLGDCFFRKDSDHKKWKHVDANDVIGIEVDEDNEVVFYHLKISEKKNQYTNTLEIGVDKVPAHAMVHFSLSDDMADTSKFGESHLYSCMRAFKQKRLLEDAIIIYRVVRAPEHRAFYVNTGNANPMKQKAILEQVKIDQKQKRIPSTDGGQEDVDGILNPLTMLDDYFFAVDAQGRSSRVEILSGGANLGENGDLNIFKDALITGLRVPNSYMTNNPGQQGALFNDGKVGTALLEEARYVGMVKRYQQKQERVYDQEFKMFLKNTGIAIEEHLFKLRLPDPQNFDSYRKAALNSELMATFTQAQEVKYLSKRFILKYFLNLSEDLIQTNEALLRQELGMADEDGTLAENVEDIQRFYNVDYVVPTEETDTGADTGMGGEEPQEPEQLPAPPTEEAPPEEEPTEEPPTDGTEEPQKEEPNLPPAPVIKP